ncbi:hypothetical protein V6Z11_D01G219800 [Gossypium hirsutum]
MRTCALAFPRFPRAESPILSLNKFLLRGFQETGVNEGRGMCLTTFEEAKNSLVVEMNLLTKLLMGRWFPKITTFLDNHSSQMPNQNRVPMEAKGGCPFDKDKLFMKQSIHNERGCGLH